MLHEKKREEKEDKCYQRSQANEILLGFVRELKESSERKATLAKKKWQQFAALTSALISNITQTNQASK